MEAPLSLTGLADQNEAHQVGGKNLAEENDT